MVIVPYRYCIENADLSQLEVGYMIKISKMADYAVVLLSQMVIHTEPMISASVLASETRLSEPTVSKVLKLLSKAKIIHSNRGVHGGYTLSKDAHDISLDEIISAVDGPVMVTACSDSVIPDCSLHECCNLRGRWNEINTEIRNILKSKTLADMANTNKKMEVA